MLGLRGMESGKHAVVYVGSEGDRLLFINNKWQQSDAPARLALTQEELSSRLDASAVVATLTRIAPCAADLTDRMRRSIPILQRNAAEICALCDTTVSASALRGRLDALFRALLLDGITMMSLAGEEALAERLRPLQQGLLSAVRQAPDTPVRLGDYLPPDALAAAAQAYAKRIEREIEANAR